MRSCVDYQERRTNGQFLFFCGTLSRYLFEDMKSLIVTAHPSIKGFTHRIAKAYANAKGDSEIMNLYDEKWQQPFLQFEDMRHFPDNETRNRIQSKIAEAKELVFVFPLWWGTMPAILKNFFDQNFTSGFAFRYHNGKPRGLLKGKTARIFVTCDAPKWMYGIFFFPFFITISLFTLRFCGVKVVSKTIFDEKRKADEKKLTEWIQKVEKMAKR